MNGLFTRENISTMTKDVSKGLLFLAVVYPIAFGTFIFSQKIKNSIKTKVDDYIYNLINAKNTEVQKMIDTKIEPIIDAINITHRRVSGVPDTSLQFSDFDSGSIDIMLLRDRQYGANGEITPLTARDKLGQKRVDERNNQIINDLILENVNNIFNVNYDLMGNPYEVQEQMEEKVDDDDDEESDDDLGQEPHEEIWPNHL